MRIAGRDWWPSKPMAGGFAHLAVLWFFVVATPASAAVVTSVQTEGRDLRIVFEENRPPVFSFTNSEQGVVVRLATGVQLPGPFIPRIMNLQNPYFTRVVMSDSDIQVNTAHAFQFVSVTADRNSIIIRAHDREGGDIARSVRYVQRGPSSFPVRTRLGHATVLRFKSPVQHVIVGEQNFFRAFILEQATRERRDFVVVKPLADRVQSSLQVIAEDGVYTFTLYEDPYSSPEIYVDVPSHDEVQTGDPFLSEVSHALRIASGEVRDPSARLIDTNDSRAIVVGGQNARLQHVRTVYFRSVEVFVFQLANLTEDNLIIQPERFYFDENVVGVGVEGERMVPPRGARMIYVVKTSQTVPTGNGRPRVRTPAEDIQDEVNQMSRGAQNPRGRR